VDGFGVGQLGIRQGTAGVGNDRARSRGKAVAETAIARPAPMGGFCREFVTGL
jgi:hypothetical protein